MPVNIIQITDTHLLPYEGSHLEGFPTDQSLAAVLSAVAPLQPDYLLLTGDLADAGAEAAYIKLAELLKPLEIPTLWLDGNHDLAEPMAEILAETPFISAKSLELGGWRLLLLSSVIKDKCTPAGELGTETLTWLRSQLEQHYQPTLIALHHPPVLTGVPWLDPMGLKNKEKFHEAIAPFNHVQLVIFGHIHHEFQTTYSGVSYYGCPSTCVQFAPAQAGDHQIKLPGLRLISLNADGSHSTSVHRVLFDHEKLQLIQY